MGGDIMQSPFFKHFRSVELIFLKQYGKPVRKLPELPVIIRAFLHARGQQILMERGKIIFISIQLLQLIQKAHL